MLIAAPAKINLYLKIIRRMDDGYHELETLFERISIFDRVAVESAEETLITCDDPCVPVDKNSLLGRAVEAFKRKSGNDRHFRVDLEKNIPVGAGLGGGSSDAAALLKGLNSVSGNPLDEKTLVSVARDLGADIPFFLSDYSFGWGTGRGDVIREVKTSAKIWHVLVNPPFEVSTREVYGRVDLSGFDLTKDMAVDKMITAFLKEKNIDSLAKNLRNDLQTIVLRELPVLEQIFSELKNSGAKGVLLSGSGSTVFGIFERKKAIKAGDRIRNLFPPEEKWRVFVARTC